MSTIVEMRLDARKQGGSERYICQLEFWKLMIELGQAFGWKQLGATYVAIPIKQARSPELRKRDYEPGAWRDAKRVEKGDASSWARALNTARSSPHLNKMTKSRRRWMGPPNCGVDIHNRRTDTGLVDAMDDFIRYLDKGAFSFASGVSTDTVVPMPSALR